MEAVRSLSAKGQVVVPKEIREYLGAKEGDKICFSINKEGEVIVKVVKEPDLLDLFGSMPPKVKTDKDFEEILKESKEERMQRRVGEGNIDEY